MFEETWESCKTENLYIDICYATPFCDKSDCEHINQTMQCPTLNLTFGL